MSHENDDDVQVIHTDFGSRVDEKYIGDGVYVSHDSLQIWLRTGDGNNQQIALDLRTYLSLVEYAKHIGMDKRP